MNDRRESRDEFDSWYAEPERPRVYQDIWSSVYGDDYPEGADPNSFVTVTDLARMANLLNVSQQHIIADIGCGRGGPGLWVAKRTGARLIGIDISPLAVQHATNRVSGTEYAGQVRFQQGEFAATRLPDHALDGVMSADAILFAPARFAACQEIRRICKPGGLFVFTTWELRRPSVYLGLDPIQDYRPLLELAGFRVEAYEETPDWERQMRQIFDSILSRIDEIREQRGEAEANGMQHWATARPPELSDNRRVLVAARAV